MVLFQAFGESGQVDNFDAPVIAFPRGPGDPSGSPAISFRQSTIGLTAGTFGWMTPTNDYLAVRS